MNIEIVFENDELFFGREEKFDILVDGTKIAELQEYSSDTLNVRAYFKGIYLVLYKGRCGEAKSFSITAPLEWAESILDNKHYRLTIDVNSGKIGAISGEFDFKFPNSFAPSVSFTLSDSTSLFNKFGHYIKLHSKLAISCRAQGMYDATIKRYEVFLKFNNGKRVYKVDYNSSLVNDVLDPRYLDLPGSVEVIVVAYDSRGFTGQTSQTIDVLDYRIGKSSITSVFRCTKSGQQDPSGDYASVTFDASICSNLPATYANYEIVYTRRDIFSEVNYIELTELNGNGSIKGYTAIFPLDRDFNYHVWINISDGVASYGGIKHVISSAKVLIAINKNEMSIGIGKPPISGNTLDIGLYAKFSNTTNLVRTNVLTLYHSDNNSGSVGSDGKPLTWTNNTQTRLVFAGANIQFGANYGCSEGDSIIVSPSPESFEEYCNCGVRCIKSELNAAYDFDLTFSCDTEPSKDLEVNVLVVKTFTDS